METLAGGMYPAAVTPIRGESFDGESLSFNLRRWNGTGLAGYLLLGSNGEGVLLDDDDAVRVVEAGVAARASGKSVLAGTGRESTRRTVELTRRAARAGADAVLVTPPSYYRGSMTETALESHYRTVAEASDVPVLLYNVPKFCPVELSARMILRLAEHPRIAGLKDSSGDLLLLQAVLAHRPPGFRVFVGTGSLLHLGLLLGADGGICALAGVAPEECVEIERLVLAGRTDEARLVQSRLLALNHSVTTAHGVAGLKYAMELAGYRGGECIRPLAPLGEGARADVAATLAKARGRPARA